VFGFSKTSKKVDLEYKRLVSALGGEINILTKVSLEEIAKVSGPKIAEGVQKTRKGDLVIDPGYDGVYGVVKIWNGEEAKKDPQLELFD
jgi:PHP family Zn ribbon phosphoesterase